LRQNGLTEAAYIDLERKLAVRLQMSGAFAEGAGTPKALVDLAARYNAETRVAEYVTIGAKLVGEIPAPDNDALARFFEPRKASFRAPEYRKLNLIVLSPEELAPFSTVPDDRLNLEVARERDRLDRRTIQQIPFPSPAEAEAAAQKIKDGATFEAIAAERNIAPADLSLGALSRADVADPAVRDAAFALEANTVSAPIAGRFGTVLLRVTAISPFNEEQVREEVRRRLALDIARDSVNDLHDKIEKDRLSGLPIAELAVRAGVSPIVVDAVDAQGRDPSEAPLNLAGERDLLAAAFRADVGSDNDPVLIRQSGTYIWYEIASITPARDRTLEDVRERVLTRWQEEEVKARIGAAATEMVTSLKAGETLAAIATKLGLEVRTTKPLARAATEGDWGQPSVQALFSTLKGQVADAPAIDGIDRLVFLVKDVTVPASAGLDARILSQLTQSIEDDILGQYITRLQTDFGTSVNRTLLRRAVGGET
ncbi:MAG: peptidylprolyl isomerase, partial [Alphaproteobacteria bacterium]